MREEGFEPSQALSHLVLSQAHLTALALPHKNKLPTEYKKLGIFDLVIEGEISSLTILKFNVVSKVFKLYALTKT